MATKPNLPTPKNRPNPIGWVGSILADRWIDCTPLVKTWKLYSLFDISKRTHLAITSDKENFIKKIVEMICIIKLVSMIGPCKSYVVPITTCYLNNNKTLAPIFLRLTINPQQFS